MYKYIQGIYIYMEGSEAGGCSARGPRFEAKLEVWNDGPMGATDCFFMCK